MLGQGIHKISKEEYLSDPCEQPSITRGVVHDIHSSCPALARFKHPKLNPDREQETADKFDIGTAGHSLLLEDEDNIVVLEADDWRKKAVKDERDTLRAEGKTVLLRKQYEDALLMKTAAKLQIAMSMLKINDFKKQGKAEMTYIWEEQGIWFRGRPDWVSNDNTLMIDYKTTSASANPQSFASIVVNNALDVQCALYRRGAGILNGITPRFVLIVQETFEPFLCSFMDLSPEFEQLGKDKIMYATFIWKKCLETGIWPGYPQEIATLDAPAWALAQFESIAERIGE